MKTKELTRIQIAEVIVMRVCGIILLLFREACSDEYVYQSNWHLLIPLLLGFTLIIASGMLQFYYKGYFELFDEIDNENTSGCNRQGK